jgi:hypothetical protein
MPCGPSTHITEDPSPAGREPPRPSPSDWSDHPAASPRQGDVGRVPSGGGQGSSGRGGRGRRVGRIGAALREIERVPVQGP